MLACARTRVEPADRARVRALARGPLDWVRVLRLARQHGVVPLLYHHLHAIAATEAPAAVVTELRARALASARRSLRLTHELVSVLDALRARDISALPYKGPVLALAAYGGTTLRPFADLDILVPKERVAEARAVLLARGYHDALVGEVGRLGSSHYQHTLVRDAGRTPVELHWAFAPAYFRLPLPFAALRVESAPLAGVMVPAIAPPDLLVLLCIHGGRHLWSRLEWICDLAELVRARPDADWPAALDRAEAVGARRMLLLGVALARDLLDADVPAVLARALASDPAAGQLARTFGRRLFRDGAGSPPLLVTARLHLAMRERWRDRAIYVLLGALTPSERDAPGLARRWRVLRVLLRPVRLARDYGICRARDRRPATPGAGRRV